VNVSAQRDLVRHRSGRHEQRRFGAEEIRDALLELPHRRIFAVDVIADLRRSHRLAHRSGRAGDGIGPKINGWHAR